MKFTCLNCRNSYALPDDKLPRGKILAFPCPDCGKRIEIDFRQNSDGINQSPLQNAPEANETAKPPGENKATEIDLKSRILKDLGELPPMPQIVFKAHEVMENPNSSTKQVAELIESDQVIAAKVLKMANSAYYGMSGKVSSVQQASVVLGFKALGELITLAGTSNLLGDKLFGYDMDSGKLWKHSMMVAFGSKIISQRKFPKLENDAFSAGLIHDVGKLALDRPVLNRRSLFEEFLASGDQTFLSAENRILGFDHAEIGFEMCQHWQIPDTLANAIRYHHHVPADLPEEEGAEKLASIVSIANTIANMADAATTMESIETGLDAFMFMLDDEMMNRLNLEEGDIEPIMHEAIESVEKITLDVQPA
jgi:putative nucleotidyltransferase with HDIG domain